MLVGPYFLGVHTLLTMNAFEPAFTFTHPHVIPHENNTPILVARRPKRPLKEIWPDVKCFSC